MCPKKIGIDETNAYILKTLLQDSRTSFTKIAKQLGITEQKLRGYLRWFELRKMVIVDWETQSAQIAGGLGKLLAQQ